MQVRAFTTASRIGQFWIAQRPSTERWHVLHGDAAVDGPFTTPQHALDDLCGGHGYWPDGVDTSTLGLSSAIAEWKVCSVPDWFR